MQAAGRARAERTENMFCMVVMLDVSRLSGWLKADALCRVKRKHKKRGGMRVGKRAWGGRQRRKERAGGPDYGGCWQGTLGAHLKHGLHGCDAGRVEA